MMKKPRILVVGSMNMDLFVQGANKIARFGETLPCREYGTGCGGKGSNQALAAAKLGAEVTMVGRVGTDDYGKQLAAALEKGGVNTEHVVMDGEKQTGLALLLVNQDGRYVCYTVPGANDHLCEEDVRSALCLEGASFDMVILQLEMPLETVYSTIKLANQQNIPVFLDAGPAMQIALEPLKGLYILSPNEVETESLTGICPDTEERAVEAARILYEKARPQYVILKLGARGALLYDGKKAEMYPCFTVDAVDSTAAGDTFGAALAIRLCMGDTMAAAMCYAHAAAGICVSRQGAQASIPTADEVECFLKNLMQK